MKVFINPGHDINLDSGAVNPVYGTRECDVASDAGKMLRDISKQQDVKYALCKMTI